MIVLQVFYIVTVIIFAIRVMNSNDETAQTLDTIAVFTALGFFFNTLS